MMCFGHTGGNKQQFHVRWGPSEESDEDLSSSNPPITASPEFDAVVSQVGGTNCLGCMIIILHQLESPFSYGLTFNPATCT